MTIFQKRLKVLRTERSLTQGELGKVMNLSTSGISNYENGYSTPDFEMLKKLADYFEVSVDYLMGASNMRQSPEGVTRIGVVGKIEAGIPMEAIQEYIDWEEIPESLAKTGEFFALQIQGHSMEPKMSPGDVVIVRRQECVENGEIAIVMVNGNDATIKRVKYTDSGIMLIPSNPTYEPIFYTPEQVEELPVKILGKVVELRAKF